MFKFLTPDKTTYNDYVPNDVDGYIVEGELLDKLNELYPFYTLVMSDNQITDIVDDVIARAEALPTIDEVRAAKIAEISAATERVIKAGIDVTTTYGMEHFSLDDHDQTNITNLGGLGKAGIAWLYHADDGNCKLYSAADLVKISTAALQQVTYHTTYYNYIKQWVTRETDAEVIQSIIYGAELPDDLASTLTALLNAVSGGGT